MKRFVFSASFTFHLEWGEKSWRFFAPSLSAPSRLSSIAMIWIHPSHSVGFVCPSPQLHHSLHWLVPRRLRPFVNLIRRSIQISQLKAKQIAEIQTLARARVRTLAASIPISRCHTICRRCCCVSASMEAILFIHRMCCSLNI